ncbi:hypothetical protein FOMG_09532 [Fusarium oxysporum f. sp. melonis 26406]|uniref:Zn(2)-C6 fungal-type domain-containing protein n=1 Tax=Fusarium oxysporum f. sp. melonis 26406 TaxID=1089452 RepID=X0A6Y8_FUSOX|nr:hypothetical protein FOMG_09532 [Fusarium oxysporum f. sp. melonis 26406]
MQQELRNLAPRKITASRSTMENTEAGFLNSPASSVNTEGASPIDTSQISRRPTRVSHTKSRKGCQQCKKRKVKCDEQRPACFNCSRLQEECKYLLPPPKKTYVRRSGSPKPTISSTGGINLRDLELFHTYTTSTYSTLSIFPALQDFWRITVPRLAIHNSYLMGEILALAALHLAYHRPDQWHEHLATALTLHQESSQQAMGLLKELNPHNADGLFIFSSLTIVIAMATPKRSQQDGIPAGEGDFEDWIYLIQGTAELRTTFEQECSESCLTALFSFSRQRWALHNAFHPSYDRRDEVLCQLEERIRNSVPESEKLNVLIERIGSLRSAACYTPSWESTDLFFWLYGAIDGFLPLVKARDQEAWAVLAHFCLMVKRAETQWWLKGWADCMMRKIHKQLDEEHKSWILRLSEEMGWIPTATQ